MDEKSQSNDNRFLVEKFFFSILFSLIIVSVAITFWRIIIQKDYIIEAQTDCDPYSQRCFIWECDPASDIEGEKCVGNQEDDIWYYNITRRNASRIPLCDPNDENCAALICNDGELECEQIFCTEENKIEREVECNNPKQYAKDNPVEIDDENESEEIPSELELNSEECAPDDQACLELIEAE
ncbi:MAG TPA: hypothetical protein DCS28_01245 [Candidatus Moranbacteria bacterium]|nr:hypothetical protein [Candidatus Moranbacteria bacterium]HAT74651.1 hypothetical protein [Candidatus Moranbacteria bacterium]